MMCAANRKISEFPCGKCIPCRINQQRKWQARLQLENLYANHESWFVTLTYDPEHLPEGGSVVPRDLTLFLKRVRKAGYRFRYFACGEYGEVFGRPHYHIVAFGQFPDARALHRLWGKGRVQVGAVTDGGMAYVAGYTLKKIKKQEEPHWLNGRHPEFTRMSTKPGLGAGMAAAMAEFYMTPPGQEYSRKYGEPTEIRCNGEVWPLDRYMREKVKDAMRYAPTPLEKHQVALNRGRLRPLLTSEEKKARSAAALRKARVKLKLRQMKGKL